MPAQPVPLLPEIQEEKEKSSEEKEKPSVRTSTQRRLGSGSYPLEQHM